MFSNENIDIVKGVEDLRDVQTLNNNININTLIGEGSTKVYAKDTFSIDNIDIRKYGSQGQQRTSALSLKLSEIELVKKSINSVPVLLLDDVLSELDSNRQNYLLNSISDIQTIITCTGLEEFVKNRFKINKIFQVISGEVFEKESLEDI